MTLLDIFIRLVMGTTGSLVFATLCVAVLVPVVSKIGRWVDPDASEAGQIVMGFVILLTCSVCGAGIWMLGGWLSDVTGIL